MIRVKQKGDFKKTTGWFKSLKNRQYFKGIEQEAKKGVEALRAATPVDTGKTAESWGYVEYENEAGYTVYFTNSNKNQGRSIAVLIDRGHGTRNGGYVPGRRFIKPTIEPIMKDITDKVWKGVTSK